MLPGSDLSFYPFLSMSPVMLESVRVLRPLTGAFSARHREAPSRLTKGSYNQIIIGFQLSKWENIGFPLSDETRGVS